MTVQVVQYGHHQETTHPLPYLWLQLQTTRAKNNTIFLQKVSKKK